ncbi:helix-turn-helix domain-containing protein [uncultured Bartonella sp.]|uniref:XRE family transcriptional regulator n=1 Tax=uncultured Bartonella sp. TaxID=104108 RepID=UPI0025F00434|nr:helix-turn-helix domain-containing protein [uncultured Bartonella sp.]
MVQNVLFLNKTMDFKERIKNSRIAAKMTQEELARAVGKTRNAVAQWESGASLPRLNTLEDIAGALNVSVDWLLTGNTPNVAGTETTRTNNKMSDVKFTNGTLSPRQYMPQDVPVMGTAACCNTDNGLFKLDTSIIDYVHRPPALLMTKDLYALYVEGDTMEPRFNAGDLVFVHPHKPVRIGDSVVVQIAKTIDEPIEAMIAVLAKRTSHEVVLKKYNPEKIINFDNANIVSIHKILEMRELFGR